MFRKFINRLRNLFSTKDTQEIVRLFIAYLFLPLMLVFVLYGLLFFEDRKAYPLQDMVHFMFNMAILAALKILLVTKWETAARPLWDWAYAYVIVNVLSILMFALAYKRLGLNDKGQEVYDGATSLYFSIVTWTTLGYGDIAPMASTRFIAATEALFGSVSTAILLGLVFTSLSKRVKD